MAWQQDPQTKCGVHDGDSNEQRKRKGSERGVKVAPAMKEQAVDDVMENLAITGCAGEIKSQVNGEEVVTNAALDNTASTSPTPSSSDITTEDDTSHSQLSPTTTSSPPSRASNWEEEGEVEICVGTLDEQFLVGCRDRARNVIPNTGFGALVAHPEGRILWAENEIPEVTDGLMGERWKYGMDSGIKMVPSFEH